MMLMLIMIRHQLETPIFCDRKMAVDPNFKTIRDVLHY